MKYTVEKQVGKVVITFDVDATEWDLAVEEAYQKTKHKYNQQGFRKGHVPKKVIEGIYGVGVFYDEAFNHSFPNYYYEALEKETDIIPVADPKIEIVSLDTNGVKFTATVVIKPEVVLGQYKDIVIKKTKAVVANADIDAELKKMQDKAARMVDADRAVAENDEVNLDYSGSVDGVKFDGGTAQNQNLTIGSHTFIEGFEEQLVGMSKGENRTIKVKFPATYPSENLKDKDAEFNVTINEIKTKELPLIDDEFAKDVSEFETLEDMKKDIKKTLKTEKEKHADIEDENKLIEAIVKNAKVEIPNEMIEAQIDNFMQELEYSLSMQGLKLEDYCKYTNSTIADLRKPYTERAKVTVNTRLVLEEIIKTEKVEPNKDEVEKKIVEFATQTGKSVEDFRKGLNSEQMNYILNTVVTNSIIDFLKKANSIQ